MKIYATLAYIPTYALCSNAFSFLFSLRQIYTLISYEFNDFWFSFRKILKLNALLIPNMLIDCWRKVQPYHLTKNRIEHLRRPNHGTRALSWQPSNLNLSQHNINKKKVKQDYLTYIFLVSSTNSGYLQTIRSIWCDVGLPAYSMRACSLLAYAYTIHRTSTARLFDTAKFCPLVCLLWNLLTFG